MSRYYNDFNDSHDKDFLEHFGVLGMRWGVRHDKKYYDSKKLDRFREKCISNYKKETKSESLKTRRKIISKRSKKILNKAKKSPLNSSKMWKYIGKYSKIRGAELVNSKLFDNNENKLKKMSYGDLDAIMQKTRKEKLLTAGGVIGVAVYGQKKAKEIYRNIDGNIYLNSDLSDEKYKQIIDKCQKYAADEAINEIETNWNNFD